MAFRTKKISQMDPKGSNLASTDLLEISELVSGSYVTKSITGQEIIDSIPVPPSGITIGTTAITSGTVGRVLFEGTGNVVQESAGLTWDDTNKIFNSIGSVKASGVVSTARSIEMLYDESVGSMIRTNVYNLIHLVADSNKLATFQASGILFPANSSKLIGNTNRNLVEVFNEATGKLTAKTTGAWNLELGTNDVIRQTIFGSTGNIGINTTTDAGYKLDVNGTARFVGNARTSGSLITPYNNSSGSYLGLTSDFSGTNGFIIPFSESPYGSGRTRIINTYSGGAIEFYTSKGTDYSVSYSAMFATSGNLLINTTTDAGYKLDVNGTARVQGALSVTSNIVISAGAGVYSPFIEAGGSQVFQFGQTSAVGVNSGSNSSVASGLRSTFLVAHPWAQSSGTGEFASFRATPTYNTTGTYSGIVRGFHYKPTITSLTGATHYAIHTEAGRIRFENLPTSPAGLSSGDVWNNLGILTIV